MEGWDKAEVLATLEEYFAMMALEIAGERLYKTAVYKQLALEWGRSWKAYERKMQNISAVLALHDYPWLRGLVPLVNIQRSLEPTALQYLSEHVEARELLERYRTKRIVSYGFGDSGSSVSEPPASFSKGPREGGSVLTQEEIAEREAKCNVTGLAGENWVVDYERARLKRLGRRILPKK